MLAEFKYQYLRQYRVNNLRFTFRELWIPGLQSPRNVLLDCYERSRPFIDAHGRTSRGCVAALSPAAIGQIFNHFNVASF